MLSQSPFHARVAAANETSLWSHWAGHLVVDKYQMSEKWEYVAIRNAAGAFDSSPLYKYRIIGPDAERFLGGVLARDIRTCLPRQAQYTIWCDDRGYVNEDGVVFRYSSDDFLLTAAEPNLSYFQQLIGHDRVEISEVTEDFGSLAVQGPRSHAILAQLAPGVSSLGYFEHAPAKIGKLPVTISRSGYTGDLGYEIFCDAGDANDVWDAVFNAGQPHGLIPFGQTALLMARIEAGLLLIHVDFDVSRLAENDEHRSTPIELGLAWMLRGIEDDTRPFIGRRAILRERAEGTSRWKMVGLKVDPFDYATKYTAAGMVPPKDHTPVHEDMMVYDGDAQRVGYATSFMYSPVLQRHIALARVRPELATPGTLVNLEFTINHRYVQVGAEVVRNPMFAPPRKNAPMNGEGQ
ncbi:aminomethyltransferase family protein [Ilumatobacter sp.]|uniref:aminomethyltransferase family protein n=1 Tax=Ilumatobacter sp. TaxID=1967498 RepID=UPI003750965B